MICPDYCYPRRDSDETDRMATGDTSGWNASHIFILGIARMAAHAVTRGLKTGYKKFGRMRLVPHRILPRWKLANRRKSASTATPTNAPGKFSVCRSASIRCLTIHRVKGVSIWKRCSAIKLRPCQMIWKTPREKRGFKRLIAWTGMW